MLNGIDIASYQAGIVPSRLTTTDFVIVKATGGTDYANPYCAGQAGGSAAAGKLIGFYHFAREYGCAGTAQAEADYFTAKVKPYIGKATLWLDWEAGAIPLGPAWAKAWLDRVKAKTGVTPGIYMSKGVCRQYDWSAVVKAGYPLWVAQYPDYEPTGYKSNPWTDDYGYGAWSKPRIFQYASTGRLTGYPGNLDLDLHYGGRPEWNAMCAKAGAVAKAVAAVKSAVSNANAASKARTIQRGRVAAAIHKDMCDTDTNGYSWSPRLGEDGKGYRTVTVDGDKYEYDQGSYDCSSSSITAWKAALKGTPYEHALDGATYTGNMRSVFVGSGLFSWKPMSFLAAPGDLYLSEEHHVAMCQTQYPDVLSEFSGNEHGGAYGGQVGDQTGREAWVHAYYDYPWDGILHYNGKADTVVSDEKKPTGTPYRIVKAVKVRKSRKTVPSNVVGRLTKGKEVYLAAVKKDDKGNIWGRITYGPFKGRVIAVTYGGAPRAVKVGSKTVDQLAREVIAGDWGDGQARRDALAKKGYDPDAVQRRVNEILG